MEENQEYAYIYKMSWYRSPRHTIPCGNMYFLSEKYTRWGHNWRCGCNGADNCKIFVIKVRMDSTEYLVASQSDDASDKTERRRKTLGERKEAILTYLLLNCEDNAETNELYKNNHYVKDGFWSLADLFIRQYLNNGCDGFGLKNVRRVYNYLIKHKDDLIKFNLVSMRGFNNCGWALWEDFAFERKLRIGSRFHDVKTTK